MTYQIRNIVSIVNLYYGKPIVKGVLWNATDLQGWPLRLYTYLIGCHVGHTLDFIAALGFWLLVWPFTYPGAGTLAFSWISKVVAYNLACEVALFGFWHWMTYASKFATGAFSTTKYNPVNQYESAQSTAFMFRSSSGQLEREMLLTTLGWLQSSAFQVLMMWGWASGRVPVYLDFWAHPWTSICGLVFVTYWREFHFYWVHRMIHPWSSTGAWWDLGQYLYKFFHSWHHKSYNCGPWSGLSMHPVEHFFYYTCTLLPLFYTAHPLHFLYAKFHADIAPIGGHDGHSDPGGGGDFHWLHHAKYVVMWCDLTLPSNCSHPPNHYLPPSCITMCCRYECNYGVPLIPFDFLFGSWADYNKFKKTGSLEQSFVPSPLAWFRRSRSVPTTSKVR